MIAIHAGERGQSWLAKVTQQGSPELGGTAKNWPLPANPQAFNPRGTEPQVPFTSHHLFLPQDGHALSHRGQRSAGQIQNR